MTDHRRRDADEGREARLDSLIRDSRRGDAPFERPDDDTIWAFLSGAASTSQLESMHAALYASAEFRREFVEMAEDCDRASQQRIAELLEPIANESVPSLERLRKRVRQRSKVSGDDGFVERLARLLWSPGFAYALVLLAVILPFVMPLNEAPTQASDPVVPSESLSVIGRAGDITRGIEEDLLEIALEPSRILDLTIWSTRPIRLGENTKYRLLIEGENSAPIQEDGDFRRFLSINDEIAFKILLDTSRLEPGLVTIDIAETTDGGSLQTAAQVRLLFSR